MQPHVGVQTDVTAEIGETAARRRNVVNAKNTGKSYARTVVSELVDVVAATDITDIKYYKNFL